MNLSIKIDAKYFYSIIVVIALFGISSVLAYDPSFQGDETSPPIFGHSSDEVNLLIGGSPITLQNAIDQGLLGGGGVVYEGAIGSYTGNIGGYDQADQECKNVFGSNARMATADDFAHIKPTDTGWYNSHSTALIGSGGESRTDCSGWNTATSLQFGPVWIPSAGGGFPSRALCNILSPILCVSDTGGFGSGGSGGGTYVGATTATYNGAGVGGYAGGDAKCSAQFLGSRMCTAADFANRRPDAEGWYNTFTMTNPGALALDCNAWSSNSGTISGSLMWAGSDQPATHACSFSHPILCCQSQSGGGAPSGAIMMFESNCPAGWSLYAPLQGRFPRGEPAYNPSSLDQGGSDDAVVVQHAHTLTGYAGSGSGVSQLGAPALAGPTVTTSTEGISGIGKNLPSYAELIFCKKEAAGGGSSAGGGLSLENVSGGSVMEIRHSGIPPNCPANWSQIGPYVESVPGASMSVNLCYRTDRPCQVMYLRAASTPPTCPAGWTEAALTADIAHGGQAWDTASNSLRTCYFCH